METGQTTDRQPAADNAGLTGQDQPAILNQGRHVLAIPGPTTIPDAVLAAMHRPAIDIYGSQLTDLAESLLADLKRLFATAGDCFIYAANGHGGWEACLTNILSRGDRVLVLESGRFARGWGEAAAMLGARVETLPGDDRRAVNPQAVAARLGADKTGQIKLVLVVQVDTASGCANDIAAIRQAMNAADHPALLAVDVTASLATMPFAMDAWGVDLAMAAAQKGLMTPPGLAFVAAGPRAMAAHRIAGLRTPYWDWTKRLNTEHYMRFCGTAPLHLLFGLRQALDMLLMEGLENAIRRHHTLATAVRAAASRWCEGGRMDFNIEAPADRADSVTTLLLPEPMIVALLAHCETRSGVTLGRGIGPFRNRAFRISHMGHVNAATILGILGAMETALQACDIPHGKDGIGAAIQTLATATRQQPGNNGQP